MLLYGAKGWSEIIYMLEDTFAAWRVSSHVQRPLRENKYFSVCEKETTNPGPADTWRLYNVDSTSMQRHDVASTLRRRCINVMCPLGRLQDCAVPLGSSQDVQQITWSLYSVGTCKQHKIARCPGTATITGQGHSQLTTPRGRVSKPWQTVHKAQIKEKQSN